MSVEQHSFRFDDVFMHVKYVDLFAHVIITMWHRDQIMTTGTL